MIQILSVSPRNSQEAQFNLFDKTDCHFLAFAGSFTAIVEPLLHERDDMKAIEVASFDAWFDDTSVSYYPYDKTFEEARWDPLCVLHTSGSTGLPKPIIVRQGVLALSDAWQDAPEWEGMTTLWNKFIFGSKRHYLTSKPLPPSLNLSCQKASQLTYTKSAILPRGGHLHELFDFRLLHDSYCSWHCRSPNLL